MKWKKLESPGSDEWKGFLADFEKKSGFKFTKHPRYFVDENLGAGTTDFLRQLKAKVTDVWEEGLVGKGDEHIWRFCQAQQRILLTHDDDFLDERLFPTRKCYGAVVLPHQSGGEQELSEKLNNFVYQTSAGQGFMFETKIVIRENNHWEVRSIGKTAVLENRLFDLSDPNHIFLLNDD